MSAAQLFTLIPQFSESEDETMKSSDGNLLFNDGEAFYKLDEEERAQLLNSQKPKQKQANTKNIVSSNERGTTKQRAEHAARILYKDVKDVLATSITIGLSLALGISTNNLVGSILDKAVPGKPGNVGHQALRVILLTIIMVVITLVIAQVLKPRAALAAGPFALLQEAEKQVRSI